MFDPNSKTNATSHLAGYCEEIERIAGTLVGMLSQCRTLSVALGEDRKPIESLLPVLQDLTEQVEKTLAYDDGNAAADQAARPSSGARVVEWTEATPQSPPQPIVETSSVAPVPPPAPPPKSAIAQQVEALFAERITPDLEELDSAGVPRGFPALQRCAEVLMADLKRQTGWDDPERTGEVTFQGTSESLPLPSVFEMFGATKKTGTLNVKTTEELLSFEIVRGELVASSTTNPPPRQLLGQILIDFGFVEPDVLQGFLLTHKSPPKIGAALENGELVGMDQLRTALEYQVRHRLLRAFRAERSAFTFTEGGPLEADDRLRFNVAQLLLERRMNH
ncbi:MAG: DUF4388 domain-containing protein [Planctomycetes bacterium]|nr:DUF4388 domain-containing protein [Planctomycetota bacterium]